MEIYKNYAWPLDAYLSFCSEFKGLHLVLFQQTAVVLATKEFLIVIADDDNDDQYFMSEALKNSSFAGAISCVDDGEKLLEYLKDSPSKPGLILLDLNMPFKDGYQTLTELKSNPSLKNIPTVILTSSSSVEDEKECYRRGCDKFYRKPMSLNDYQQIAGDVIKQFIKNSR